MSKEIRALIRDLRHRAGWTVVKSKRNGHYKATYQNGGFIFFSSSPRCPFVLKNIMGDVARVERDHTKHKKRELKNDSTAGTDSA